MSRQVGGLQLEGCTVRWQHSRRTSISSSLLVVVINGTVKHHMLCDVPPGRSSPVGRLYVRWLHYLGEQVLVVVVKYVSSHG